MTWDEAFVIMVVILYVLECVMKYIQGIGEIRLRELLAKMKSVRAVLIGDMCLDVYWVGDMTKSRLSRETPHFPLPIVEERFSPGAGGNAAVNIATLCDNFTPIGIIGNDWRGRCLTDAFAERGIASDGFVVSNERITNAYCKPMRKGYLGIEVEDPRLDFESFSPISKETEDAIIEKLTRYTSDADVLCVSDQFENGCITQRVRDAINKLAENGLLTVVDSRYRIDAFRRCLLKPNEIECATATGIDLSDRATENDFIEAVHRLSQKTNSNVCMTLGARGCLLYNSDRVTRVNAISVPSPVDTVGAGDCFLSALALALAAGASDAEAGVVASMASAICVKKMNTTGSANESELLALFESNGESKND